MGDWIEWNTLVVLMGMAALGLGSGMLGTFAVLRRESLVGDALAHAALPGVCLAWLVTGGKHLPALLAGAAVTGLLGVILMVALVRYTRLKQDVGIGTILTVFFGAGIVLLTLIQNQQGGSRSGLANFIFGQAANMLISDVIWILAAFVLISLVLLVLFKEFSLVSFDPDFAHATGLPVTALNLLLMGLLVLGVIIGLQAVGVILIAGLLIIPGATARLWTQRIRVMFWLSGGMGLATGMVGTWLSSKLPKAGTGPVIILVASALFAVSLLLAPHRGLIARAWLHFRLRRQIRFQHLLRAVFEHAEISGRPISETVSEQVFAAFRNMPLEPLHKDLVSLAGAGLAQLHDAGFVLTPEGVEAAKRATRIHRLWEHYLHQEVNIPLDELDAQADQFEHMPVPTRLFGTPIADAVPPSAHPLDSGSQPKEHGR